MLRLLIDTSTLLDLAKRCDGQKWIVSLGVFTHQSRLELLVPTVVIDESGGEDQQHALDVLEGLAHQVPLIGAMTTRNFESTFGLGLDGLSTVLLDHFGDELKEILEESDYKEEPRRLDEILEAEHEFFDRVWHHRSLQHEMRLEQEANPEGVRELLQVAGPGRCRVEAQWRAPGQLGPSTDFELGMLNGKLSALRRVLGSEWDFLDT